MTTLTTSSAPPRMLDQSGVRFGIASGVLVLTMFLVAVLPLGLGGRAFLVLIATAALGTVLPLTYTVGLAVQAWACFTGFLVNGEGVLTLGTHDVRNLLGFVVGTVVLAQVWSPAPLLRGARK